MFADKVRAALSEAGSRLEPHVSDAASMAAAGARLKPAVMGAQRFVFDADTSEAVGALGMADPGILGEVMPMARLPFPRTWLEIDIGAAMRGAGAEASGGPPVVAYLLEETDPETGAFTSTAVSPIVGVLGGEMTEAQMQARVFVSPISIAVNPSGEAPERADGRTAALLEAIGAGSGGRGLDAFLVGSAARRAWDLGLYDELMGFAAHGALVLEPRVGAVVRRALAGPLAPVARHVLLDTLKEMAGDFRRVVAALALINARDRAVEWASMPRGDQPSRGATYRGKPYLDYRRVSLAVPRAVVLADPARHLGVRDGSPRRRHAVAAHWCHSRKVGDPTCHHDWGMVDPRRFVCRACGMKRWRRDAMERGDARIGYVVKDRVLVAGDGIGAVASLADAEAWGVAAPSDPADVSDPGPSGPSGG